MVVVTMSIVVADSVAVEVDGTKDVAVTSNPLAVVTVTVLGELVTV